MNEPHSSLSVWQRAWYPFPTFRRMFGWIFRWRTIRAGLFGLVCLATFLGLFYAFEDWRGVWAWNKYKRELEAKGEKMDWRAFIPPPVPDEQNFAMAPLLKPLLDYEEHPTLTDFGIKWRDTNGQARLRALTSRQPPGINPDWQNGRKLDLAACQKYFRSQTNWPPVASQQQTPALDVLLALSPCGPELAELRAASARPSARFPVHYEEGMGTLLPHLGFMSGVSHLLSLRAAAELEAGRSDQALDDVKLSFYLGDTVKEEPFIISHLVRLAIVEQSLQAVWEGLAERRWSSNQLATLTDYLKTVDLLADYSRGVRGERSSGAFARTLSDPIQRAGVLRFMFPSGAFTPRFVRVVGWFPKGWFYLNDLTAARFYQEKVLPLIDPVRRRAYPDKARAASHEFEEAQATPANAIVRAFGLFIAPQKFARGQTDVDLALVACALERYRQAHGHFPDTTAELVPACLDRLPADIIAGQPLKYRRSDDGQFLLYSVGWDETDDHGQFPSPLPDSSIRTGLRSWMIDSQEKGDWVWRYPTGAH